MWETLVDYQEKARIDLHWALTADSAQIYMAARNYVAKNYGELLSYK